MKTRLTNFLLLTVGISALAFVPPAQAITVLFLNDFESGTTQFWGNGFAPPCVWLASEEATHPLAGRPRLSVEPYPCAE